MMIDTEGSVKLREEPIPLSEAARRLDMSPSTLARQARLGRISAEKIGPIWLTTAGEVERYRRDSRGRPGRKSIGEP